MSAGEPEETDAYQQIFDDMINSEVDYEVTVVAKLPSAPRTVTS